MISLLLRYYVCVFIIFQVSLVSFEFSVLDAMLTPESVSTVIDDVPRFIDEAPQLAHGLLQLSDSQIRDGLPQTIDGVPQVQDVSKRVHVPVDLCDHDFFSHCETVSSDAEESATEESATVMPNNAKPLSMPIGDDDSCMRHDLSVKLITQSLASGKLLEIEPCCHSESENSQLPAKVSDLDALLVASLWLIGPHKCRKVLAKQYHLEPPVSVIHLGRFGCHTRALIPEGPPVYVPPDDF